MNSHPVSIDIVSDDIIEPQDESFKITLLFPQGQPFPRVTLDPNVATITILGMLISVVIASYFE